MNENHRAAGNRVDRRRWYIHLILIGGYFVPGILFSFRHTRHQPALSSNVSGLLVISGMQLAFFALLFGLGWLASRASREELFLIWRPGWWVVPLGVVYSVAIRLAAGFALFLIVLSLLLTRVLTRESLPEFVKASHPGVERLVDVSALQHNSAYFWLVVTLESFVIAGLREELWRAGTLAGMRALWPSTFNGRDGQIAAVALIAILFGAAHLSLGMVAAAAASLLGFFLGLIMVVHRSIWPAVIAHGLLDATSFALLPWAERLRHIH